MMSNDPFAQGETTQQTFIVIEQGSVHSPQKTTSNDQTTLYIPFSSKKANFRAQGKQCVISLQS